MESFDCLNPDEARAFAEPWLDAWHGNRPELLASFYAPDAFYSDPAVPDGISGRPALDGYFARLLGKNPEWIWRHTGSTPMEGGFLNRWQATIPVEGRVVECSGVCTVRLEDGLISRNEVFFDRSPLLRAMGV